MYKRMDWETTEDQETPPAKLNLKVAVQINRETQPRIFVMVSEEQHCFTPARNEFDFIIVDTCSGMSYFNRLMMHDSIHWSKTEIVLVARTCKRTWANSLLKLCEARLAIEDEKVVQRPVSEFH